MDKHDVEYINKIKEYFINISKDAPIPLNTAFLRSDVGDLFGTIMRYCSTKFESRLKKLKDYITKINIFYLSQNLRM